MKHCVYEEAGAARPRHKTIVNTRQPASVALNRRRTAQPLVERNGQRGGPAAGQGGSTKSPEVATAAAAAATTAEDATAATERRTL
jgi:hypothetical protein